MFDFIKNKYLIKNGDRNPFVDSDGQYCESGDSMDPDFFLDPEILFWIRIRTDI